MPRRTLPDFPWDSLAPYRERASAVPGGIVDLSIGTPVDSTPAVLQEALREAADAPGYPQTYGTPDLRDAVAHWFARRRGVPGLDPAGALDDMPLDLLLRLGLVPLDRSGAEELVARGNAAREPAAGGGLGPDRRASDRRASV